MLGPVIAGLESMTEAQQAELLGVQFSAEMQKEAEAEVDSMCLAEACYTLGELKAERALAESEGLDKVASAEDIAAHDQAVKEVGEDIDALVQNLGIDKIEDPIELHKEAQAAAGLIFQGYADHIEKVASKHGDMAHKFLGKAKGAMHAAGAHLKHHKGKYAGGAAGALAAGYAAKHLMKKKSSEMTGEELVEIMNARDSYQAGIAELQEGVEKLAGKAAEMGKMVAGKAKSALEAAKKHKAAAGAAAGGAAAGYAAGRLHKKD